MRLLLVGVACCQGCADFRLSGESVEIDPHGSIDLPVECEPK